MGRGACAVINFLAVRKPIAASRNLVTTSVDIPSVRKVAGCGRRESTQALSCLRQKSKDAPAIGERLQGRCRRNKIAQPFGNQCSTLVLQELARCLLYGRDPVVVTFFR